MTFATGVNLDVAGGPVIAKQQNWTLNGLAILTLLDPILPHESTNEGDHENAFMAQGSTWFTIDGIPVCRMGDLASCNDPLIASQKWFQIS